MKKLLFTGLAVSTLTACVQSAHNETSSRKPISVNSHAKRLNTVACQDLDDWYLDGYRVGKDFSTYKENQLNQRGQICGGITAAQRNSWDNGYLVGNKKDTKKKRTKRRRARA